MTGKNWESEGCYWSKRLMAEWIGAMLVTRADAVQEVIYAADNMLTFLSCSKVAFLERCGAGFMALVHPDDRAGLQEEITQQVACHNHFEAEYRLLRENGEVLWVSDRGTRVNDEAGQAVYIRIIVDVSSRRKLHEQLLRRAQIDPLTEIYNRGIIESEIDAYLRHCAGRSLSALFILDLDNFKQVNDIYGHMAGDQALVDIAYTLQENFRSGDMIGRLGGDEFLVLMKDVREKDDVIKKAQTICQKVRAQFDQRFAQAGLSASIGVLLIDGHHPVAFDDAYSAADCALYQAKTQGKNGYYVDDRPVSEWCLS